MRVSGMRVSGRCPRPRSPEKSSSKNCGFQPKSSNLPDKREPRLVFEVFESLCHFFDPPSLPRSTTKNDCRHVIGTEHYGSNVRNNKFTGSQISGRSGGTAGYEVSGLLWPSSLPQFRIRGCPPPSNTPPRLSLVVNNLFQAIRGSVECL